MPPVDRSDELKDRVTIVDLDQILPQQNNANKHTQRGMAMLNHSISTLGWSGAGEMAANGELYHGSGGREEVETLFNADGNGKAIVLKHDGTMPVYLQRIDIPTADDPRAVKLGVDHNRIAEVNLNWDPVVLIESNNKGLLDIDDRWFPDEQVQLLNFEENQPQAEEGPQEDEPEEGDNEYSNTGFKGKFPVTLILDEETHNRWIEWKKQCDRERNESAFLALLDETTV